MQIKGSPSTLVCMVINLDDEYFDILKKNTLSEDAVDIAIRYNGMEKKFSLNELVNILGFNE